MPACVPQRAELDSRQSELDETVDQRGVRVQELADLLDRVNNAVLTCFHRGRCRSGVGHKRLSLKIYMMFHVAASCVSPQNEHARAPSTDAFLVNTSFPLSDEPPAKLQSAHLHGAACEWRPPAAETAGFCSQMLTDQRHAAARGAATEVTLLKTKIGGRGVSSCARRQNNLTGIDEIEKLAQVDRERIRLAGEGFADTKRLNQSRAPHFERCTCIGNLYQYKNGYQSSEKSGASLPYKNERYGRRYRGKGSGKAGL